MSETGERPRTQAGSGVVGAFLSCARSHPDRVALIQNETSITYAELERRSRAVAAALAARGFGRDDLVQIAFGRSIDFIVALLGVVRTGAAYVPIDPQWPDERRRALERITRPAAVILPEDAEKTSDPSRPTHIGIDRLLRDGDSSADAFEDARTDPDDPIYVMFTSGTTGEPKGVIVPHRAVSRLVTDPDYLETEPVIPEGDRCWLHLAATSFDAATLEVWMPLVRGHRIAIVDDAIPSLDRIAEVIERSRVTDAWLTASLFNAMVDLRPDAFAGMLQVLTGGERISPDHAGRFLDRWPGVQLINGYGPTENTTFTCCHTITRDDTTLADGVPIGVPISGTTVRIVDEDLHDVEDGQPGELLAGGDGVALGYLNDADLTQSRFVSDGGRTWYRTGDLVRRDRPVDPIAYLGRRDRQVKVRGHRIELDEVERALCAHRGVATAYAVTSGEHADQRELVAAYEPVRDADLITPHALRAWVLDRVPKPIVPDRLVVLDQVPVGPNGKADREAITRLISAEQAQPGGSVETERERSNQPSPENGNSSGLSDSAWHRLASLIEEILPSVEFDQDSRFVAIGGHSLAALRLAALARHRHGVEIQLHEILSAGMLAELVHRFEGAQELAADAPLEIEPRPTASSIQRQFFFENAVDPTGVAYLEHVAFIADERGFSTLLVSEAFARLTDRHEALRTRLVLEGDALVQEIDPPSETAMSRVTIHDPLTVSATKGRTDPIASAVRVAVSRPFDMEREWPVRLDLFPLKGGDWAVVLTFQHAAIDEWSLRIIADEFATLHDRPDAALDAPGRYALYSTREAQRIDQDEAMRIADRLRGIARPNLRLGRAPAQSVERRIPWIARAEINDLAARLGATPTAVACGVYAASIARVTGLERVAMLTPISRRIEAALQRVVGCCNTMHAVIIDTPDVNTAEGCRRVIASASAAIAEAYEKPPVPFDAVARALHANGVRDHATVPFGFAYETNAPFCPMLETLASRPLPIRSPIARFPLGLSIDTRDADPVAIFSSPQGEGAQDTVGHFAEAFTAVLADIARLSPEFVRGDGPSRIGELVETEPARSGDSHARRTLSVAESSRAESIAKSAWTGILGAPPQGESAHFFNAGGHSLLLLRLAARIRVDAGVEIPLGAFLDDPTFQKLVALVASRMSEPESVREDAGFQIEELGDGERVVVCIPGAFGRPISFGRLAEEIASRDAGIRLRCYNVYDAMSGKSVPEGFERVLTQLDRDFRKPETAGMLGFCAGGLYPLFLQALAETRMRRLRLWLLNVFATDPPDQWLSLRVQSLRDAAIEPSGLPAATRDSLVTLWRMMMVRIRGSEAGVSGDQFTHAEFQKVLARRSLGVWRGGSTVLIAGRKPVWRTYYRNSRLNGLADKLQGPTRTVILPLMHHELLTRGAATIADAIERDVEASKPEGVA